MAERQELRVRIRGRRNVPGSAGIPMAQCSTWEPPRGSDWRRNPCPSTANSRKQQVRSEYWIRMFTRSRPIADEYRRVSSKRTEFIILGDLCQWKESGPLALSYQYPDLSATKDLAILWQGVGHVRALTAVRFSRPIAVIFILSQQKAFQYYNEPTCLYPTPFERLAL